MKLAYKPIFIFIGICLVILLIFLGQNKVILQNEQEMVILLQDIFPQATYYNYNEEQDMYQVYDNDKHRIGYAFFTEGRGYGGNIYMLVGLEDKETIRGITIISHNEQLTMGYTTIELDFTTFIEQFNGLKITDCYLSESNNKIDSITKATISSKAVIDIVREAAAVKSKLIK